MANWGQLNAMSFNRCWHRIIGDSLGFNDDTEDCCASVACSLCLKLLDTYGGLVDGVSMDYSEGGYVGVVGDHTFRGEWIREYGTDRCVFQVTINESEYDEILLVYYKCPEYPEEGMDCRYPEGEYQLEDGTTIRWELPEVLKLPRIVGTPPTHDTPGTLSELFCGDCDCIPEKLCLTLTGPDCEVKEIVEILLDPYSTSECPSAPEWLVSMSCGYFELEGSILLRRGDDGSCEFVFAGGYDEEIVDPGECPNISGTWTFEDGYDVYTLRAEAAGCDTCGNDFPSGLPCPCKTLPRTFRATYSYHSGTAPGNTCIGRTVFCEARLFPNATSPVTYHANWSSDWSKEVFIPGSGGVISDDPPELWITCGVGFGQTGFGCDRVELGPFFVIYRFGRIVNQFNSNPPDTNGSCFCDPVEIIGFIQNFDCGIAPSASDGLTRIVITP